MDTEQHVVREDATLAAVRTRGLQYLGYLFWAFTVLAILIFFQLLATLTERWLAILDATRKAFGFSAPERAPDYYLLAGFAAAVLVIAAALLLAYRAYRRAWNRRLELVWGDSPVPSRLSIHPLRPRASGRELRLRADYLEALAVSPEWRGVALAACDDPRLRYTGSAAAVLKAVELDIARRAIAAGLVVGLNRNPIIDSLSIVAAALELQMHVLTRLGKRPSLGTWVDMFKRTAASLFLNWYVSREDALYLKLAIKKTAWGMGAASDLAQQAADAVDDIDWDEILGSSAGVPGLSLLSSLAAKGIGIGAFGLRHVASFIEAASDDLLQGVLAGGVLYYHGISLAAECLSLDAEHRKSAAMNRTISQAMTVALEPAARLLLDQVRALRRFLRERRRLAFAAAKDKVKQGAGTAFESVWSGLKSATRKSGLGNAE
jgi:hypothetical protein